MNLKTIVISHLNEWKQTANKTIFIGVDNAVIKDTYHRFFEELSLSIPEGHPIASFTKVWDAMCRKYEKVLAAYLKKSCPEDAAKPTFETDCARVANKFRGNVAEILFEGAVQCGFFAKWVSPVDYDPVNPHQEEQLDAEGRTNLGSHPIGIQIKNWHGGNKIEEKTFRDMAAMAWEWMVQGKIKVDTTSLPTYMYVVSFCAEGYFDDVNSDLQDRYKGTVHFVGPKEVNKALKKQAGFFAELAKLV